MFEEIRIGRLTPDEIDDECAESIRDMWLRAGNLISEGQTNPVLTSAIRDINSPGNLRREVSRRDSGIYVVKGLGSGALMAAAKVTTKKGRVAPQYGDNQVGRPMYMEIFGAPQTARVLAGLGGAALSLLGNLRGPLGNPVPVRMGSIEEELPNAA